MKAGNKNEGQQTARPNEGIWIISWTSKRTANTHIWFPSHKSNPATRACGVRFLTQHYNTTGHVRRLEDSVTPLRMACSRGTANKAPRETPGGARRENRCRVSANSGHCNGTRMESESESKAAKRKVLPDHLKYNDGHQSKDRFNMEATWGGLLINHLWVSHIPPTEGQCDLDGALC